MPAIYTCPSFFPLTIPLWFIFTIWFVSLFIKFFGSKEPEISKGPDPSALVIIPCKGADLMMGSNLEAAKHQKYRKYSMVAVVDSADDPAVVHLKKHHIPYILSTEACSNCSGKVRAIATAISKYPKFDVYVILDSDVRVGKDWLAELVAPLSSSAYGMSTTYPIYRPYNGRFWEKVKMYWSTVGLSLLEYKKTRFGWGGSLAFKKSLIRHNMGKFKETVSDDITLTEIAKKEGAAIYYSKKAQPVVFCSETRETFFEWSNRQTALSMLSNGNLFYYGLLKYVSEALMVVFGITLSFIDPIFMLLLLPTATAVTKDYIRTGSRDIISSIVIHLILPFIFLLNFTSARRMQTITWRGKTYKLK
ncbi:MAG: glycosyltransferase [Candidatus Micrarchaeia archaeon]